MSWIYLFIAGIFEIVWAVALKYADGFSNWFYSAVTIIGMVASVYFLAVAMRTIPLGTAYAILDRYRVYWRLYCRHSLVWRSFHCLQNCFRFAYRHRNHWLEILGFLISKHSETRRPVVSHKSVLLKSGLST